MSKHAAEALTQLHAPASAILISPHAAIAMRRLAGVVTEAEDMGKAAPALLALLLATEEAAKALDAGAEAMRAALTAVLSDTGMPAAQTQHHTASVRDGSPGVVITDLALIPPTLMRQADPTPDKAAIAKALKAGGTVPGAELRNGQPILTIRTRNTAP
jgi:hypothetical protein